MVDSRASMHMVSKRDHNSAELETMGTSRNPTTVMAANGEVQTREKPRNVSKSWTYSSKLCFLKKHAQFCRSGSSARIMGFLTTGPAVKKNTSHQKKQEN